MAILKNNIYVVLIIVLALIANFIIFSQLAKDESNYIKIEVQKGDTIWNFAQEYAEFSSKNNDEFVKWVVERNAINEGIIYEGQELILPVEENNEEFLLASK
ncbi:LysM peptidoglycan-binding domain-containing protein [Cytobacillus oceanisediminis]|uniref:cell division suppressor protein YneA n=1 Tax=Cytobacillus oceanisediminis TaxID=665099 RepID=UPI001C23E634|nr:LysM peptidoglycan-binding domain-containing protein [Cytobacillus oceanisediminis]MBU8732485.1 LysM peptidoglycan-binding domain-containing protein [Cytobacillus oceanisediminis]